MLPVVCQPVTSECYLLDITATIRMKRMARQLKWDVGEMHLGGGFGGVISVYVGSDMDSRKGHTYEIDFMAVSNH